MSDARHALERHLRELSLSDAVLEPLLRAGAGWRLAELLDFATSLHERVTNSGMSGDEQLTTLHYEDLALAWRCAGGAPDAIGDFERRYAAEISAVKLRFRLDDDSHNELVQRMRDKLFVAEPGARPRILDYSGKSELLSWLRVLLSRLAIDQTRARKRRPEHGAEDLSELVFADGHDPETALLKARYGAEFRDALVTAIAGLTAEDRNALRAHYVRGLSVDQIAPAFGIHRATAARRIVKARGALIDGTRRALQQRLDIGPETLDSVLGLIQSGLHASIVRLLG